MNAPHKPSQCSIDPSYCKFGSETLTKLLEAFENQIGGVIESQDIEYVHRMRVASRRIRATMPLFQSSYPKKKFKKWLREVKKVTRLLGEARDLDVQIAFIQAYLQKLNSSTESVGLAPLLKNHKNQRKTIQTNVTNGLEALQKSGVLEEMTEFLKQTTVEPIESSFDASSVLERAYWHLSSRIDNFLALEEYVHREKAILKHHEMRINAKWLRYTMEVFAPLYKTGLSEEIEVIKGFQDVLGEMHDCDVWIDYLPKFIAKTKTSNARKKRGKKTASPAMRKKALRKFLSYIKETKKSHYSHFVEMWDTNKATDFFGKLRDEAGEEVTMGKNTIAPALLSKPNLKIAVLADVHANLHALEAVVDDAEERGADIFLNAGDSVGFGAFPNEVLELLHAKNVVSVAGNFDLEVTKGTAENKGTKKIAVKFARKELEKSCESYLLSLPLEVSLEVAGKKLLMVHGSKKSVEEQIYHVTPVERLRELVEEAKSDLIIVGHSHEQFQRQVDDVSFLNPGSVGRPGDGNPQAGYALVSFRPVHFELIRLDYDVEAAANALRRKKLPESFAQMLLRGLSVDAIVKEDEANKDGTAKKCQSLTRSSQERLRSYQADIEHCEQVKNLALDLFDSLPRLHKLGRRERCWLECAAILHDVGLSVGIKGHHKKSMRIILNDTQLLFAPQERRIIASIARYHRKGLPKQKHYNLATLSNKTVTKIMVLSGVLRVADALDDSHSSVVKSLNVKIEPKRVTVEYVSASVSPLEEQAFNKKKDLFEKVFKKKLVLAWMQH